MTSGSVGREDTANGLGTCILIFLDRIFFIENLKLFRTYEFH